MSDIDLNQNNSDSGQRFTICCLRNQTASFFNDDHQVFMYLPKLHSLFPWNYHQFVYILYIQENQSNYEMQDDIRALKIFFKQNNKRLIEIEIISIKTVEQLNMMETLLENLNTFLSSPISSFLVSTSSYYSGSDRKCSVFQAVDNYIQNFTRNKFYFPLDISKYVTGDLIYQNPPLIYLNFESCFKSSLFSSSSSSALPPQEQHQEMIIFPWHYYSWMYSREEKVQMIKKIYHYNYQFDSDHDHIIHENGPILANAFRFMMSSWPDHAFEKLLTEYKEFGYYFILSCIESEQIQDISPKLFLILLTYYRNWYIPLNLIEKHISLIIESEEEEEDEGASNSLYQVEKLKLLCTKDILYQKIDYSKLPKILVEQVQHEKFQLMKLAGEKLLTKKYIAQGYLNNSYPGRIGDITYLFSC